MTENAHSRCFEYDGLRVLVESDDRDDLTWLEEFLCPQFDMVSPNGRADCLLRLSRDEKRFGERTASRAEKGSGEHIAGCFILDQQLVELPRWDMPGSSSCILDEKFRSLYIVVPDCSSVDIIADPAGPGPRIPAMRVIRELAMNHGLARGGLFVHGSSFVAGDRGFIVAGPSGSGKTTLLIHFLTSARASYVSNDRVLVRMEEQSTSLRGMPAIVTLRPTTLDMFPSLRRSLVESTFHHHFTMAESARRTKRVQAWGDGRYGLTPTQFCALLGVPRERSASASAVLVPHQTGRAGGISLTRLSPDAAEIRLHDAIFGIACWGYEASVFALPADRSPATVPELKRRCRQLAERLPFFLCELGNQAYEAGDTAVSVLEELSRL